LPTNLITTAEQVIGLILTGKQSHTGFNPEWFPRPYNLVLSDFKKGKDKSDLVATHGDGVIQPALHAAASLNGLGESCDWVSIMRTKYLSETNGQMLKKIGEQAINGVQIPADKLRAIVETVCAGEKSESIRGDEIDVDNYNPFNPSGSLAIDAHLVGMPNVGTMILGAKTFAGKTTLAIKFAANYLDTHPNKEVHFITLEDMAQAWRDRAQVILGNRPKEFWHRFIIQQFAGNVGEIMAESSRYPDLGLVIVDYVDYLAADSSLDSYAQIYRTLAMGAKSLAVTHNEQMTIMICAQFSRTNYNGGVPTPRAINYTGEAGAWMILMLYNPSKDWEVGKKDKNGKDENPYILPAVDNKAYIICWKVKAGFRNHPDEFPGAIQVGWTGSKGYDLDCTGKWFSLSK
jgi:hypothetical protein